MSQTKKGGVASFSNLLNFVITIFVFFSWIEHFITFETYIGLMAFMILMEIRANKTD